MWLDVAQGWDNKISEGCVKLKYPSVHLSIIYLSIVYQEGKTKERNKYI